VFFTVRAFGSICLKRQDYQTLDSERVSSLSMPVIVCS